MRLALMGILALLPTSALAGGLASLQDGVGSVSIEGTVELTLYRGVETLGLPAIEVGIPGENGGERLLALVTPAGGFNVMPEPIAKALGLRIKTLKIKKQAFKMAVLGELTVGSATLHDVAFMIGGEHVVLSGAVLDELAIAILPSKGQVVVAPVSYFVAVLARAGTAQAATFHRSVVVQLHGQAIGPTAPFLSVQGSAAGMTGDLSLRTDSFDSKRSAEGFEGEPVFGNGARYVMSPVVLGGTEIGQTWVLVDGRYPEAQGRVGYGLLHSYDLAASVSAKQVAFQSVDDPTWTDSSAISVEIAKFDFDKAAPKAEAEPSNTAKGLDKGDTAEVGRQLAYADALSTAGQLELALTHYEAAAAVAGDTCRAPLSYAEALIKAGRADKAIEPATKAGTVYDVWMVNDLQTRLDLQHSKGGARADAAVFDLPQDMSCHTAWGTLAEAHLARGEHELVAKVHLAHRDLDPLLPLAHGISLAAQGQYVASEGRVREAINLGNRTNENTRLALALVAARNDKDDLALAQLDRVLLGSSQPSLSAAVGLVLVADEVGGADASKKAADELVARAPDSVSAWAAYGFDALRTGDTGRMAKASERVDGLVKAASGRFANSANTQCQAAAAHAVTGNAAAANALLTEVGKADYPADCLTASALVASTLGDEAKVGAALARMAQRYPVQVVGAAGLIRAVGSAPSAVPGGDEGAE